MAETTEKTVYFLKMIFFHRKLSRESKDEKSAVISALENATLSLGISQLVVCILLFYNY